jgi:serine-type D-Ala-D-Ala carboxypeptidase/endopeptidase (penicillin-binding protein 4)
MLRRGLLAGLAAVVAGAMLTFASATSTAAYSSADGEAREKNSVAGLEVRLRRALASPGIDPGQTGALAVDLRTGGVVFQRNTALSLIPASAEKLTVAFAALRQLGSSFRFHTEVLGAGQLVGNEWQGDLYLVGYGDPTLAVADVGRLARDVRAAGIRRVTGSVVGDEHHFDARRTAPGWKPSFLGIESPPLSALVVDGVPVPGANSSAVVAARALSAALARRGVVVGGAPRAARAPVGTRQLAVDHSARLGVIVLQMNRESDNFVAEMLLKGLGATVLGRGATHAGAEVVRGTLADAGVPLDGVRVVDGSGLSSLDRLTVRSLVVLLRAAARDRDMGDTFVSSLAIAGVSGTLRNRLAQRPTRGRVIAKTGTTSRSCALAGFVGRRYVFAILQNGAPVSYWSARVAQDRFVTILARA